MISSSPRRRIEDEIIPVQAQPARRTPGCEGPWRGIARSRSTLRVAVFHKTPWSDRRRGARGGVIPWAPMMTSASISPPSSNGHGSVGVRLPRWRGKRRVATALSESTAGQSGVEQVGTVGQSQPLARRVWACSARLILEMTRPSCCRCASTIHSRCPATLRPASSQRRSCAATRIAFGEARATPILLQLRRQPGPPGCRSRPRRGRIQAVAPPMPPPMIAARVMTSAVDFSCPARLHSRRLRTFSHGCRRSWVGGGDDSDAKAGSALRRGRSACVTVRGDEHGRRDVGHCNNPGPSGPPTQRLTACSCPSRRSAWWSAPPTQVRTAWASIFVGPITTWPSAQSHGVDGHVPPAAGVLLPGLASVRSPSPTFSVAVGSTQRVA